MLLVVVDGYSPISAWNYDWNSSTTGTARRLNWHDISTRGKDPDPANRVKVRLGACWNLSNDGLVSPETVSPSQNPVWGCNKSDARTLSLGLQVPSEKVFGVGLEGPNTF